MKLYVFPIAPNPTKVRLYLAEKTAGGAMIDLPQVSVNRHAINPNVYGVAHATTAALNDLNSLLNRNGGNNTTRYNWQLKSHRGGRDETWNHDVRY